MTPWRLALSCGRTRGDILGAVAIALAAAAAFWLPAIGAARGWFPAPLDDVYIHFDFARSLASGHIFEWIAGQGYSSGETSPLYAAVLACGWLLGFRGRAIGIWAAIVAIASVASLVATLRSFIRPSSRWLGWLVAMLPLSIAVADWSLFSGMEVALFTAALVHSLAALKRVRAGARGGPTRERRQWRLGAWGAALVLLRPEAVVVIAVLAVLASRGVGRRSAVAAVARTTLPGALATSAILLLNLVYTGDPRSAGAQLKLLTSNPFLSDVDRARAFVENLITFWVRVIRGDPALGWMMPTLALCALCTRRHRTIAAAALGSAALWTLLVSLNGNAPFHNFRYYVPGLVLLSVAAACGIGAIASWLGPRRGPLVGALVGFAVIGFGFRQLPAQVEYFRRATANIRDQQIEVGLRLRTLTEGARVLVGDAGAIPFVSERPAVDALGLGGYHRVPFARAAVHGEAAIVELIERLSPSERPTHLALYPNWFGALTARFGIEVDRVTILDNVICGGPTKGIYRADWSALGPPTPERSTALIDELDVADILDEGAHGYAAPTPQGGWTTLDVLAQNDGVRRFDGGRIIPGGKTESFVVLGSERGPVKLRMRIDSGANGIALHRERGGERKSLQLETPRAGVWREASIELEGVKRGEKLTLEATGGEYRDYHVWLERLGAD